LQKWLSLFYNLIMLALIDNYDSFTYNLVQYFAELGAEVRVFRNDQITLDELIALQPGHLVISPGPGNPTESGISLRALAHFSGQIPVLGVCLGHQCLAHQFGARVERAILPMHGKISSVHHSAEGIFLNIPTPFNVTRYHSLIVSEPLPPDLQVTARTADGEVMGLQHRQHPTFGVQFHPEAILTEYGHLLLQNFCNCSGMKSLA
jgi:anthranilate synthase component II